jgi:hypothetical protein
MRCIACGAELQSTPFELENTAMVPSDEHCRFLCSDCDRPLLVGPDHALSPDRPEQTSSALSASLRSAAPDLPASPALIEADNDLDQCEALLKSAIALVRGPARCSQRAERLASGGTPRLDGSLPVHSAPSMWHVASAEADGDLDECELLLKRAVALVRGPAHRPRLIRLGRAGRVVQIQHDPKDATYFATDTKSGLSVLRHRDRARLLTMCDRLGWQVIEDAALKAAE